VSLSLKNKVVIITGASSGIGKACAFAFAKEGCRVMLSARDELKLSGIAEQIDPSGGKVAFCKTDVSVEADCRNLIARTKEIFGTIDILINNAGITMRAMFAEADLGVLHRLMDTNFWGTVYCTRFAIEELLKNKGTVVGISSIAGYKGLPGRTGYSASKFAMQGFLESLRIENLKTGLHVMIVCPGYTESNIRNTALDREGKQQGESPFDEGKLMSADEVADAVVRGVKQRRHTIVLTLQGKFTILLNKFFPAFMDKMVYRLVAREKDSPFK
jgi:short-subunit dehydrogenase